MIDLQKALALAVESNKKILGIGAVKKDKDYCPHDLYTQSVNMANAIAVHAVKGTFADKLFLERSPNQTEAEFKYIKANYKQYTLPVFIDLLSTTSRIFADNNWSIAWTKNDEIKNYISSEIPMYGSLESYMKYIALPNKLIDANSFIAVRPYELPLMDAEIEGMKVKVIDPSIKYTPVPVYFKSSQVIYYDYAEEYLFLSSEKSIVTFNGKEEKSGSVYEWYTPKAVYFIKQKGKKTDNLFDVIEYLQYETIPVIQLKGSPSLVGEEILWQSPFIYAVDLLDTCLTNENWLQASVNKCVYPHVVMYGEACTFTQDNAVCNDGVLINSENGVQKTCPKCHGSGLKSRLSQVGTILLNPSTKTESGDSAMTQKPLEFISPETGALDFIVNKIARDEERARKILHIQTSNTSVKGSENMTATGIAIDVKTMFSFIKPISDQLFDVFQFVMARMVEQRFSNADEIPVLSYPKTFDFKSPEDYLKEISDAIANNLPPSFIQYVLMNYINSIYGDSDKTIAVFSLIMESDRLFGMSQDEINMKLSKVTATKWEDILHTSAVFFINKLLLSDAKFLDKDMKTKIELVQNEAKEVAKGLDEALTNLIYDTPPPVV